MFVIKCYGGSCNYYVGSPTGTGVMKKSEAHRFVSENVARSVGCVLYGEHRIGHWEVRCAKKT